MFKNILAIVIGNLITVGILFLAAVGLGYFLLQIILPFLVQFPGAIV